MNMENNKMISFDDIIKACFKKREVYIPLIQRNYKWDCDTAAKLATDLGKAFLKKQETYTVGMITFYNESNEKMQLIDGQQRIITLYMLLKFLNPNEEYFSFGFERDNGITESEHTRRNYLKNITSPEYLTDNLYTDLIRFRNNYNKIQEQLTISEDKYEAFSAYIKGHVYFLLHISEAEPFDEFINLNKNKTRFVISDRIKANLVIDSQEKLKKDEVLKLFKDLSEMLFLKKDIWNLVQQGYLASDLPEDNKRQRCRLYSDENRLKLLCCERYGSDDCDVSSTLGYEYNKELACLKKYRNILAILLTDINKGSWSSYNAFNCLYKLNTLQGDENNLRFFKMLESENCDYLEEYLLEECKRKNDPFFQACFIESQLCEGKSKLEYIDISKGFKEDFIKDEQGWLSNGASEFPCFERIYSTYIMGKYKNKEGF